MRKKESHFTRFINQVRDLKFIENDYRYAVALGMLCSFFVFMKGLYTYIFADITLFSSKENYFFYLISLFLLVVLIFLLLSGVIPRRNRMAIIIIKSYPYLFLSATLLGSFIYVQISSRIIAVFITLIMVSLMQVYTNRERNILFLYGFVFFNGLSLLLYGFGRTVFDNLSYSAMAAGISYVTSFIHYNIYRKQKASIDALDESNKDINTAVEVLEKTNRELRQSHRVTASMLKLTQEVLKNEQIEDLMQLVLDETLNLIPHAQAGSILILKENNRMEYVAAQGYKLENLQRIHLNYEDLYQAHFDDPYEPNIIKNLEVFDEVHIGEEKTKMIFAEAKKTAKSCLTCSFRYEGEFYGSINIDNFDSESIYTDLDSYLLKQLAQELEIIITIHYLYEKALRPTKYDGLTQAYTRSYSMKLLQEMVESNHKKCIGVCTIDINQLKAINDGYGHDVGDQYLSYFSESVRMANIKDNIFGRIGGDEFILVFANLDPDECKKEIEKLRKHLKDNRFKADGFSGEVTFSYGIAMYPTDSSNLADLIKISDRKMYEEKRKQN